MKGLVELEGNIWLVDLYEDMYPGRTSCYLVQGKDGWMLIDPGSTNNFYMIRKAVEELDIAYGDIKFIAVTHIHIDHAGGLGNAAKYFGEASLIVHNKGSKHMIDPNKLIKGATAAWGEKKMKEFGEIKPVNKNRIIDAYEGDKIDLGDRIIEFWDTPGHSRFHLGFYDSKTNGLFCGDLGIYFPVLSEVYKQPVVRVPTPIPEFECDSFFDSLRRLVMSNLDKLYFTHFGENTNPKLLSEILMGQLLLNLNLVKKHQGKSNGKDEIFNTLMSSIKYSLLGSKEKEPEILNEHMESEWGYLKDILFMGIEGIENYLESTDTGKVNCF